ncbi:MAG: hypothetical protein ABI056_07025 [Caulobacteraceae bacterium]
MADEASTTEIIAGLERRLRRLEAVYGLVDLLALPGLLAGGASRIFDCTQTSETLWPQAEGFYGKEAVGSDLVIRWTRFPAPGRVDIAVFEGLAFVLELHVLHMPHVAEAADLAISDADGEPIAFESAGNRGNGVLKFIATLPPRATGIVRLFLSSKTYLQGSGTDIRQLGLPFVQLRGRPDLSSFASDT